VEFVAGLRGPGTDARIVESGAVARGAVGRNTRERRSALVSYTEAPIRQGRLDNPWEGLVGGVVLGEVREAEALIRKAAKNPEKARRVVVAAARRIRPEWPVIVKAAESIRGRSWREMCEGHGDWGRDGVVAVATRHLGWGLVEVSGKMPGVKYGSLAQGVRRFWRPAGERTELEEFARRMRRKCKQNGADPVPLAHRHGAPETIGGN